MHKLWIQAAMMLGGVIRGTIGGALGYLNTLLMSGFTTATKFHQEGIAFARELGMNAKEAQAYTEVLTERTERLAMKYGVAAEQVHELQKNISVATSRQLMLNDSQAEGFLQLNKLVGSSTVSKFTEEMMNGMGGQIDTVQGAVAKAYATAAKSGLSAQKVSEKIASNLGMANRLSFRTGIEGLTRMAMKAEKVGMSLQSVEAAADKFREIDQAIENTARLQMLGGNAAIMGGNPLDIAYEANYDPEALQERMTKMLGGYAQFDAQKGISSINGINMDFVRNIAQAMGISTEEASKIAKKNAEVKYKETQFGGQLNALGLNEEQKDFLINKSHIKNGQMMYTDINGKEHNLSEEGISSEVLQEMMKYEGMSDHEIMAQNAESLTSINDILKGIKESIGAMFSKFIEGLFPQFQGDLKNFGAWAKDKLEPVAKNVGVAVRGVYDWVKDNKETFKSLASGVIGFIKFATEHWKILLTVLGGLKLFKLLGNAGIVGRGGGLASSAANAARRGIMGLVRNIWNASKGMFLNNRAAYSMNRASSGRVMSAIKAPFQSFGALSRGAKALTAGGAGTGIGIGAYNALTADNAADRGAGIGQAVGTAIGAVIGGPVGAAIGGFLGDFGGRFIGEHWDDITSTVSKSWDAIKNWFTQAWDGWLGNIAQIFFPLYGVIKHWDDITAWFSKVWTKISNLWDSFTTKLGNAISKFWDFVTNPIKYIKQGASDAVDGAKSFAKGLLEKGKNFFGFANGGIVPDIGAGTGDTVPAMLSPGERVIPKGGVFAKPVGEPQYIYIPKNGSTSNVNGNTVTVKDFNININGTLKLDGGSSSKNLDIRELLNDREFVNALKDVVKTAINNDINGGRHMNDLAVMGGYPAQTNIYGK